MAAGFALIDNSTISGNTVVANGLQNGYFGYPGGAAGGVLAQYSRSGPTTIDHSTIAFNRVVNAPSGTDAQISGGVTAWNFSFTYNGNDYTFNADVQVRNTIVARNVYNLTDPDVTGTFQSQGHNLIGVLGAGATGFVVSDLRGTAASPLDPRLRPLAYRGGPTMSHALMRGSPAINADDNADAPPTDQRGRDRIIGGTIDIGSFEAGRSRDDDGDGDSASGEVGGLDSSAGLLVVNLGPAPGQVTGVGSDGSPPLAASGGATPKQGAVTNRLYRSPGGVPKPPLPTSFARLYRAMQPTRAGDDDLGEPHPWSSLTP